MSSRDQRGRERSRSRDRDNNRGRDGNNNNSKWERGRTDDRERDVAAARSMVKPATTKAAIEQARAERVALIKSLTSQGDLDDDKEATAKAAPVAKRARDEGGGEEGGEGGGEGNVDGDGGRQRRSHDGHDGVLRV
jgi:hypothetical protein